MKSYLIIAYILLISISCNEDKEIVKDENTKEINEVLKKNRMIAYDGREIHCTHYIVSYTYNEKQYFRIKNDCADFESTPFSYDGNQLCDAPDSLECLNFEKDAQFKGIVGMQDLEENADACVVEALKKNSMIAYDGRAMECGWYLNLYTYKDKQYFRKENKCSFPTVRDFFDCDGNQLCSNPNSLECLDVKKDAQFKSTVGMQDFGEYAEDCIDEVLKKYNMSRHDGPSPRCGNYMTLYIYKGKQYFLLENNCADMVSYFFDCDGKFHNYPLPRDFNGEFFIIGVVGMRVSGS